MVKHCLECGEKFAAGKKTVRFCSRGCYERARYAHTESVGGRFSPQESDAEALAKKLRRYGVELRALEAARSDVRQVLQTYNL